MLPPSNPVTMKVLILSLALYLCAASLLAAGRPNILVILADNVGLGNRLHGRAVPDAAPRRTGEGRHTVRIGIANDTKSPKRHRYGFAGHFADRVQLVIARRPEIPRCERKNLSATYQTTDPRMTLKRSS